MTREMWDQRYDADDFVYGTEPEPFFKQQIDKLKPGRLLLPAEGEGRNAVYAASLGWDVTAFDQSDVGRQKALRLASARGVKIEYLLQDLLTINCPENFYDAIALSFVHIPDKARQSVHRDLLKFLRYGGTLILQGFSRDQMDYNSGGPKDPAMLFTPEAIRQDFGEMNILMLDKLVVTMDSGEGHRGPGSVVRLIALKE